MKIIASALSLAWIMACHGESPESANKNRIPPPNIIFILCDDLGYGDVHCLNPKRGKIPTPRMDGFTQEGMFFTEAHASASVCSPSRYSLLTGRYNWRSSRPFGIVPKWGDPLIGENRLTVPELLKQNGYVTACIGKWHLGWDWSPAIRDDEKASTDAKGKTKDIEVSSVRKELWQKVFSKPIPGGPTTRGFDYYFGTDVPNWPPYCFIENDKTLGVPTEYLPDEFLKPKLAGQQGPAIPNWKLEAILPAITAKACEYIEREAKKTSPYFLYLSLTSPHTPIVPNEEWKGKSGVGDYGDFVMETDAMIGRVLDQVDASGDASNTLIFISSDNGCAPHVIPELNAKGHFSSADRRGSKFDLWDGGHREPLLARWPSVIKPGTSSGQMVCLTDFMATCADILQVKLPDDAGEDSCSLLGILKGNDEPVRKSLVSAAKSLSIREGRWKLLMGPGSTDLKKDGEGLDSSKSQLYDISRDVGEKKNLAAKHPEVVLALKNKLEKLIADGRSTPGAPQKNDTQVNMELLNKSSVITAH